MTRVHISLPTADLPAAEAFYTALFAGGPDKKHADHLRFQPTDVPIALALVPGSPTPTAQHYGVKLDSAEAVQAAITRIVEAGLAHQVQADTTCCYARMERVWVNDPDGRPWEVYAVTDDQQAQREPSDACCVPQQAKRSSGCCG